MTSPPLTLYGSSCTTGGSTCGYATGNVFNFADAGNIDDLETPVLQTGKVHIMTENLDLLSLHARQQYSFFFLFNNLYTTVSMYMCGLASIYQLNQKKNKRILD